MFWPRYLSPIFLKITVERTTMAATETTSPRRKCADCGAELPAHLPSELCPKCLLKAGLSTQPVTGPGGTVALPAPMKPPRGLPQPGELFGHYRIVRLLGQGGMGAAFEADDLDSGRCVALKVLSHTLDSPEARERFFREGRLAASINHPNSVYVFGTEEIGGTPVIAMELVSGGTLQDRVSARGALPVGEAVDAVLQMIAGLEAAQQIGILHRDVKPSNCFRDADGTVKIGDFGLSISTTVRTEPALTATGAFLGTPAFCSPEQLRGDELNVRSDMYSVGATLFYLLTGRTPFEAKNTVQLLATVLEQRPPSPAKFRPDMPRGLAKVILRCLEKQPGERFKHYRDLARALTPYSSAAPTPATLGLRFLAGLLDFFLLNLVVMTIWLPLMGSPMEFMDPSFVRSPRALLAMLAGVIFSVLYYALTEGIWGATAGKALCRLRVVGAGNNPPGIPRALLRAGFYVVLPMLPYWLIYGSNPRAYLGSSFATQYLLGISFYFVLALLFSTMRRRNGFAAVHDLVTKTRVISRVAFLARPALAVKETPPPALEGQRTIGPYHVLETLEKTADAEWLLGYDLRLLRKVWIRVVSSETPPVPAALRNVGRVGRLRWLTGKRTPEENWDAFEAATGEPLVRLAQTRQPWSQVRFWLYDLAREISAAQKDGTLPAMLALDRVWITGDGRAKLLDFPAPGLSSSPTNRETAVLAPPLPQHNHHQAFLKEVADAALRGEVQTLASSGEVAGPLPLHAHRLLEKLPQMPDAETVAAALRPLLQRVAEVTRWRRAAIVAGCLAFPLLATCGMFFGMTLMEQWSRKNPGLMELNMLLQHRTMVNSRWAKNQPHPTDHQFAVYIAQHYRPFITNDASWSSPLALSMIKGEARRFAEQSVAENPAPSEKEIADAETALKGRLPPADSLKFMKQPSFPVMLISVTLAIYVGFPALIAALAFRGGLVLLIVGVTFVQRDGAWASRLRVFWRAIVAWSPLLLELIVFVTLQKPLGTLPAALLGLLLICGLALLSLALPTRGLPDRLAGTWPVPR